MKRSDTSTEQSELDTWAKRVIPKAVAYARTLLSNQSDAEDVVQDVLCRLLRHREYDLLADGEKIMFRSITNACINRRTRRRQTWSLDAAPGDADRPFTVVSARRDADPAEVAVHRELLDSVGRALAALPSMQRSAVELKALGHSLKEIAEILNVSQSNAGVLIHRARKRLADRLAPIIGQRNRS